MPASDHGSDDAATDDDATTDDDGTTDDDAAEYVGEYDKLVRDDVPGVVRADGNHPVTRRVDGTEYDRYVAAKLREEVDEVLDAFGSQDAASVVRDAEDDADGERAESDDERAESDGERAESDDELLSELADAYAVLDAIAAARGYSMATVRERAREKADARGGFADGVVLERIDPPASRDGGRTDEE